MLFAGPPCLAEAGQTAQILAEKVQAEKARAVLAALALSEIIEVMRQ